jgi:two-component system response regulator RstA
VELKHGSSQDENWRILIVEDDERLANLTKAYLGSNGL